MARRTRCQIARRSHTTRTGIRTAIPIHLGRGYGLGLPAVPLAARLCVVCLFVCRDTFAACVGSAEYDLDSTSMHTLAVRCPGCGCCAVSRGVACATSLLALLLIDLPAIACEGIEAVAHGTLQILASRLKDLLAHSYHRTAPYRLTPHQYSAF